MANASTKDKQMPYCMIEEWRMDYNENRPHSTLEFLTPKEFAQREENMLRRNSNA